jgi:hypothetical protein
MSESLRKKERVGSKQSNSKVQHPTFNVQPVRQKTAELLMPLAVFQRRGGRSADHKF